MDRSRLSAAAGGALLLALVLGVYKAGSASPAAASAAQARSAVTVIAPPKRPVAAPVRAAAASPAEAPAELPRSLEGTEPDGALDVGPDGHLILGPRVIELFDYFFSATGEESDAVIRARIEAHARARLGEPALGEAIDLLDTYMAYRQAGRTLRIPENAGLAERLAAVREVRRAHFGDDAEALFGAEERAAEVALAKSHLVQDPDISPDERADLLAAADSQLPVAVRAAHTQATSVLDLRADEEALRADGADEDTVRAYRESKVGPEAAARLDALDQQRARFKSRIEAFRRERDLRCAELPDPTACETALLEGSFDDRERLRVRALLPTLAN